MKCKLERIRDEAFASIDENILSYKRFKRDQVFKVNTENRLLLVKINHQSKRNFISRKKLDSLFSRETIINCKLNKLNLKYFRVPNIVGAGKNFQIFEFIQGVRPSDTHLIVDALLEFQFCKLNIKKNKMVSFWFNDLNRLVRNLIVAKKNKQISITHFIKGIKLCYECQKKQKKLTYSVLKHGDFHVYNLLMDQNGKVVFLDLETGIDSQRWFFEDIARISRDPDSFPYFEPVLLKIYLEKFRNLYPKEFSELNIESQLRIGFLIKFLRAVNYTEHENIRQKSIKIVKNILMDDKAFFAWYQNDFHLDISDISE